MSLTALFTSGEESIQDRGSAFEVGLGDEEVVPIEGAYASDRDAGIRQGRGDVSQEAHELPIHCHGEANPNQIPLDAGVRMPLEEGVQRVFGDQEGGPLLLPDDLGGGPAEEGEVLHPGSFGETGKSKTTGLPTPGGLGKSL